MYQDIFRNFIYSFEIDHPGSCICTPANREDTMHFDNTEIRSPDELRSIAAVWELYLDSND